MSWSIGLSWFFVLALTGVNIFVFLKLKSASEQMMKMAFPGAKDMNEAVSQMQRMMQGMGAGGRGGANPMAAMAQQMMSNPQMQAQMKAAMEMLAQGQRRGPGKR